MCSCPYFLMHLLHPTSLLLSYMLCYVSLPFSLSLSNLCDVTTTWVVGHVNQFSHGLILVLENVNISSSLGQIFQPFLNSLRKGSHPSLYCKFSPARGQGKRPFQGPFPFLCLIRFLSTIVGCLAYKHDQASFLGMLHLSKTQSNITRLIMAILENNNNWA